MEKRIWHRCCDQGVPCEIDRPQETLVARLERTVREFPTVTGTEFFGAKLTFGQLADQV
jgi:hypothetical protein